MYKIAVSLAKRYSVPLWEVYMTHLEFLFTESGYVHKRTAHVVVICPFRRRPTALRRRHERPLSVSSFPFCAGEELINLLGHVCMLSGNISAA